MGVVSQKDIKEASLSRKSTNPNFKQDVFDFTTNFEVDRRSFETSSSKKFGRILYSCTGRCHRPRSRLILEKIRAYATAKKAAGGALVDATPATEAVLQTELGRVAKQYGGGEGVDMTKFPELKWKDPELQSLELGA